MPNNVNDLQQTIAKLQCRIDSLERENQQLKSHTTRTPLLVMGDEKELYPGEIKDIVLSVLSDAINVDRSRRNDVLNDIIAHNHYAQLGKCRFAKLKQILKKYDGMDRRMRSSLEEFGFEISNSRRNKHLVGTYYHDPRYQVVFPTTPSDHRVGLNLVTEVQHRCV